RVSPRPPGEPAGPHYYNLLGDLRGRTHADAGVTTSARSPDAIGATSWPSMVAPDASGSAGRSSANDEHRDGCAGGGALPDAPLRAAAQEDPPDCSSAPRADDTQVRVSRCGERLLEGSAYPDLDLRAPSRLHEPHPGSVQLPARRGDVLVLDTGRRVAHQRLH